MVKKNMGIREIAKMAGVSVATVSRVINTPELASGKMREKVSAVIEEYHYVPNLGARNLFAQTSNSIALFVYDLENPFFVALVKELNKIALERKCTLLICDTESDLEKEWDYLQYCEGIRTKGIIFTEGFNNNMFIKNNTHQTLVFLDRHVSSKFTTVKSDNKAGIAMLIDYLYNLGHRVFGFAGFNENVTSSIERRDAFTASLAEKDIYMSPEYIFRGDLIPDTGIKALDYFCLLKVPPTAIVCANDQIARGFIARANKMGMSVPDDFSVVGFDGCNPDYFYPKITTVRQDVHQIAIELFDSIFLDDYEPKERIIDVSFSIGDSCKKFNTST